MAGSNGRSRDGLGSPQISRRDFLNGCLIASGGLALGQFAPLRASAAESGAGVCGRPSIGDDPRFLRSGNLPSTFNVAHWLRDRRLSFEPAAVTLAPGCDDHAGKFEISDDGGRFRRHHRRGGHRRPVRPRSIFCASVPEPGSCCSRRAAAPAAMRRATRPRRCRSPPRRPAPIACFRNLDFLRDIYRELGIDWQKYIIKSPSDCYFFDEHTPGVKPGYRGWQLDFPGPFGQAQEPALQPANNG